MNKWLIGALAVLLVGYLDLLPFESVDAGRLLVVETLLIEKEAGKVYLYTVDLEGTGTDVKTAAENMNKQAPGQLFFRQTKRLILCGDTRIDLLELPEELPEGAVVYKDPQSAQELQKQLETLEPVLEAREKQEENIPTLAQLQNRLLMEQEDG